MRIIYFQLNKLITPWISPRRRRRPSSSVHIPCINKAWVLAGKYHIKHSASNPFWMIEEELLATRFGTPREQLTDMERLSRWNVAHWLVYHRPAQHTGCWAASFALLGAVESAPFDFLFFCRQPTIWWLTLTRPIEWRSEYVPRRVKMHSKSKVQHQHRW